MIDVPAELDWPITQPQLNKNYIYFGSSRIWSLSLDEKEVIKLFDTYYYGFSVSEAGEIAFINDTDQDPYGNHIPINQVGQIWLMNADGSGAKPLIKYHR